MGQGSGQAARHPLRFTRIQAPAPPGVFNLQPLLQAGWLQPVPLLSFLVWCRGPEDCLAAASPTLTFAPRQTPRTATPYPQGLPSPTANVATLPTSERSRNKSCGLPKCNYHFLGANLGRNTPAPNTCPSDWEVLPKHAKRRSLFPSVKFLVPEGPGHRL